MSRLPPSREWCFVDVLDGTSALQAARLKAQGAVVVSDEPPTAQPRVVLCGRDFLAGTRSWPYSFHIPAAGNCF